MYRISRISVFSVISVADIEELRILLGDSPAKS